MLSLLILLLWQSPNPPSPSLMEFHRTGGFAGFDDHVTIFPDGTAAINSRGKKSSRKVPSKEVAFLTRQLWESGLFDRDSSRLSEGADHITYLIRYKTVGITVPDDQVPPKLLKAVQHFFLLLGTH